MITGNVQSKNSEPQTTTTKFKINKADWHLFTSSEAWKKVTNPNRSQSAEVLTENFYKKKFKIFRNLLYQWQEKKILPQALLEKSNTKIKGQKWTILRNSLENQLQASPHPVENCHSRIQKSSQKEEKGRQGKICQRSQQQYAYKSNLEQSKTVEKQR